MIKQYRKKPVIVEAVQYKRDEDFKDNIEEIREWMSSNNSDRKIITYGPTTKYPCILEHYIETLEGNMLVSKGDYIIKGVQNEFYPCKPDIFKETYEEVKKTKKYEETNVNESSALFEYCV